MRRNVKESRQNLSKVGGKTEKLKTNDPLFNLGIYPKGWGWGILMYFGGKRRKIFFVEVPEEFLEIVRVWGEFFDKASWEIIFNKARYVLILSRDRNFDINVHLRMNSLKGVYL